MEIDSIIKSLDISSCETNDLLAYLTITLAVKSKINYRKEFYKKVKEVLMKRSEYDAQLLVELE